MGLRCQPLRQHARPRDAKAIRVQPGLAHERDVVAIAMVVVASDITAVALENGALALAKHIPRAEARASSWAAPWNRVGGRRGPQTNSAGKVQSLAEILMVGMSCIRRQWFGGQGRLLLVRTRRTWCTGTREYDGTTDQLEDAPNRIPFAQLAAFGADGIIPIALFNIAGILVGLMGNISWGSARSGSA